MGDCGPRILIFYSIEYCIFGTHIFGTHIFGLIFSASYFNQSEAIKKCLVATDWLEFGNLPQKYPTLYWKINEKM